MNETFDQEALGMRKLLACLILACTVLALYIPAGAGYNQLIVAADGEGIPVYAASSGRKQVGILYNGFDSELSLNPQNGRYSCNLTGDTTVWIDSEAAMKLLPFHLNSPRDSRADQVPCSCFLAEVVADRAELYTGTGHKHLLLEHRAGTLLMVCGTFGKDYFVEGMGFMAQSALRKVKDLTYPDTGRPDYGLTGLPEAAVFLESGRLKLAASAAGVGVYDIYGEVKNGDTVKILRDLGDWAQVAVITDAERGYGFQGFLETRYLDPAGDHSIPMAVVRTDHPLNRLYVRDVADKNSSAEVKLCSGVSVQVVSSAAGWTEIALYGEAGTKSITGFVQSAYLAAGTDADRIENACVRVRFHLPEAARYNSVLVTDGQEGTVIGVDSLNQSLNAFYVRLDSGEIIQVRDNGVSPVLEPVGTTVWKAKTTRSLTLRSGPSSSSEKIRTLKSGTSVEVLLRGEKWALVRCGGETGYVLSSGIKPKKQ